MGRILAIDYGRKRTGVAVTDELRLSINPLPVLPTEQTLDFLVQYLANEAVDVVVFGRSLRADATANPVQKAAEALARQLAAQRPDVPQAWHDEYASSREARQHLIRQGIGRQARSRRGALDSVSAGIILERYLRDEGIWP